MANYVVSGASLRAVADAIREKGGTSEALAFPDGFAQAIEDIETGGGGEWTSDGVAGNAEPSGDIVLSGNTIAAYAFYGRPITTLRGDSVTRTGAYGMYNAKSLKRVTLPKLTTLANQFFNGCTALENIYADSFPKLQGLGQQTIRGCSALGVVVLPSLKSTGAWQCMTNNGMHMLDIGGANPSSASIGSDALQGNTKLSTIILRYRYVCSLSGVASLNNTPFASGKAGGTLYVPSALVATYQAATNWSTILGYGEGAQNQILPIEGSIYENAYADGTPIA